MVVVEGVHDTVGCTLESAAEGVVVTLVVVVAHLAFAFDVYFDVFSFDIIVACSWSAALVFDVEVWVGAAAVLSLGDINLGLSVLFVTVLTTVVFDVDGVSESTAVDVDIDVCFSGTSIAVARLVAFWIAVKLRLTSLYGDLSPRSDRALRRLLRLSDRGVNVSNQ